MKLLFRLLLLFTTVFVGAIGFLYYKNILPNKQSLNFLQTSLVTIPDSTSVEKFVKPLLKKSPCKNTLYYSWGSIDKKHDISEEELSAIMQKVESIWEDSVDYNLFEYKENAPFKINFIFDERQKQSNESLLLNKELEKINYTQQNLSAEYEKMLTEHKKLLKKYKSTLKELEEKTSEYNEKVAYWNEKGGAPENEFQKLIDEKKQLEELANKAEKRRKKINALVKQINTLAAREKGLVKKYNTEVLTYKNKYGEARQFSQGEYFGTGINIYEFKDKDELVLILAHEFGHALGIGHVENSRSIMYYLMEDQDLKNPHLTREDVMALKNICSK